MTQILESEFTSVSFEGMGMNVEVKFLVPGPGFSYPQAHNPGRGTIYYPTRDYTDVRWADM